MITTNLTRVLNQISLEIYTEYKKQLGDSEIAKTMSIEVVVDKEHYDIILNIEDYWYYIENGRPAGEQPPIDDLIKWVKRKNLPIGNGAKTVEDIAYAIAQHIEANGIPGKHYLEKSLQKVNNIEDRIAEAFADDIELELENKLKTIK